MGTFHVEYEGRQEEGIFWDSKQREDLTDSRATQWSYVHVIPTR